MADGTKRLKRQLDDINPRSSIYPEGDNGGSDVALSLSGDQLSRLVEAFKTIGTANIQLIEVIEETRQGVEKTVAMQKRIILYLFIYVILIAVIATSVTLYSLHAVRETQRELVGSFQSLQITTEKTLQVVRANALALNAKIEADVETSGVASEAELIAKKEAQKAAEEALKVEVEIGTPHKRAEAQKKLEELKKPDVEVPKHKVIHNKIEKEPKDKEMEEAVDAGVESDGA